MYTARRHVGDGRSNQRRQHRTRAGAIAQHACCRAFTIRAPSQEGFAQAAWAGASSCGRLWAIESTHPGANRPTSPARMRCAG